MKIFYSLIVLVVFWLSNALSLDVIGKPVLQVPKLGTLKGLFLETSHKVAANVFLGIPYAEPPVAELRFRSPLPKRAKLGSRRKPLSCQNYKAACPQNRTQSPEPVQSEDCLYLNVFQSSRCLPTSPCPVIYYIHGGANEYDSPRDFPVEFLLDNFASRDTVLVTVGYRLGPLGFWSTETPEAPGNYALKDIVLGLTWVNKHISSFGGRPKQITIMGHSSGAQMVSLLTLSPKVRGLFQQAVAMSGSGFQGGIFATNLRYKLLAKSVGCDPNDDWSRREGFDEIVECMRQVPYQNLINAYVNPDPEDMTAVLGPGAPKSSDGLVTNAVMDGPNGLLPAPLEQLKDSRIPLPYLIGTTSKEFTTVSSTFLGRCRQHAQKFQQNPELVTKACVSYYLNQRKMDPAWQIADVTMLAKKVHNDAYVFTPLFEDAISMMNKGALVFLYEFQYEKDSDQLSTPFHAFDLYYVMGIHGDRYNWTADDQQIRNIYMNIFANFAKYGNPTPNHSYNVLLTNSRISGQEQLPAWDPLGSSSSAFCSSYYAIDLPMPQMRSPYHSLGISFWSKVAPAVARLETPTTEEINQNLVLFGEVQPKHAVHLVVLAARGGLNNTYNNFTISDLNDDSQIEVVSKWRKYNWFTVAGAAVAVIFITIIVSGALIAAYYCCLRRRRKPKRFQYSANRPRRLRSHPSTTSELSAMMVDAYDYRTFE